MCVDISHLVFEAPSDPDYEVVDEGLDCSEGGDILPSTMVQLNVHNVFGRMGEADSQMSHILDQFAYQSQSY